MLLGRALSTFPSVLVRVLYSDRTVRVRVRACVVMCYIVCGIYDLEAVVQLIQQ